MAKRTVIYPKLRTTRPLRKRVDISHKACPYCASKNIGLDANDDATGAGHCLNCNRSFAAPASATGFTTVADGSEEVFYEVSLDISALDSMARKAAGNASWKSTDGPLFVRVLATKRIGDKQ